MSQIFPDPEPEQTLDTQPTQIQEPIPNTAYYSAPPPINNRPNRPNWQATFAQQIHQSQQGAVKWFNEIGTWIFGTLTVTAIILSLDLILLGAQDHATLVSALAIALALPFNLVGLWLAQYLKDPGHAATPAKKQLVDAIALITLGVGTLFTLIGLGSALWHISWVVTLIFLLATFAGLWLIVRVLTYSK